ncbi:ATP-binding protein [Parapedobacter sp. 2B3]|uniref:ATP-binding protein n=1 Tax=Parapedobacter sp. 2B3 TaxID=3342381 RepID=UPI0035B6833D
MNTYSKYVMPFWLMAYLLSTSVALAQADEAERLKRSLGQITDSTAYVDALNRLALISYEQSADTTFHYAVRARQIADRLHYQKGRADALNNLGVVYDIKGNPQLALKYYNDAHMVYTRISDTVNVVQTLMNIGGVYRQLGRNDRSIEYVESALDLGYGLSQDSILSLVIYNYLLLFPERTGQAEADRYMRDAREIASRYNDIRTLIALDHLTAQALIDKGERESGLAVWDGVINQAIEKRLYYVSMDMLVGIGDLVATDDPARAAAYYSRGLDIADSLDYLFYSKVMARKLYDLYTTINEPAEASHYSRLLVGLYDKQELLDNTANIDYVDYAIKEQQLERLEEKSRSQTFFLLLALLGCVLAVGIILAIRQTLRVSRRLNARIVAQNLHLQKTLDALEQSQAENSRIMDVVAHDLRNPIGAISSAASMLLEMGGGMEHERKMLELIRKSATDSLGLVTGLLEVNKQAADMPKESVDLDELLRYCVDLMQSKAVAKQQDIALRSRSVTIIANREKLWRVVSNLIANAIKFSPPGGQIDVLLRVNPNGVRISVKDRGIGIPEHLRAKVFDMFTEAKRPGTDGEQPFGLGLAISKHIVEAHGGRIWFESNADNEPGTTFFLELPH